MMVQKWKHWGNITHIQLYLYLLRNTKLQFLFHGAVWDRSKWCLGLICLHPVYLYLCACGTCLCLYVCVLGVMDTAYFGFSSFKRVKNVTLGRIFLILLALFSSNVIHHVTEQSSIWFQYNCICHTEWVLFLTLGDMKQTNTSLLKPR